MYVNIYSENAFIESLKVAYKLHKQKYSKTTMRISSHVELLLVTHFIVGNKTV